MTDLYEECQALNLKCGDLIVDPYNSSVGVLFKRTRFEGEMPDNDDMYLWSIHWTKVEKSIMLLDLTSQIEEYGLKMSIVVGLYDLIPAK